ncbi:hypothetical protein QVD17_11583 [Tagetes erecta]|uniref:Uncharacterized protein n=1 Tax=Tagetes erecta TaxID=13708 RepID=A0AAD8NV33_TARER|nr:hypothetical protein QVD17_11583 [Tagetes erecta]
MDQLKNCFTTVFIIFILLAAPALSTDRTELKTVKSNTEVYEIDYRGPETHFYRPPPNRNTNGDRLQNPKTQHARKKIKKVRG